MNPFPKDWELLSLFECEPETGYEYFFRYDSIRGRDRIWCEIWRDELEVKLKWWQDDELRLDLLLRWVDSMTVETLSGCDALNLNFRDPLVSPLRFQIKPTIKLTWGTEWH